MSTFRDVALTVSTDTTPIIGSVGRCVEREGWSADGGTKTERFLDAEASAVPYRTVIEPDAS